MAVLRQDTRQIYSLHQKDTSLSDKSVAPSQYNLSWAARTIQTQQQQQHQKGLHTQYTLLHVPEYFDSLLLFIVVAFCFSFEAKGRTFCVQP